MKLRTLSIVVVVLAALSAAAYFLNRPAPPPSADPRLGQPVVAASVLEQCATLKLSDQGKSVTLTRQADGTWRVPGYYDLPADFEKLARFTSELGDAQLKRLVTSNPERLARLEFKDTKIELLDSAGHALRTISVGRTADNGGRYVRFDDEQKAFLASLNAWLDAEPKNWADSRLLSVKPDDVSSIEIPLTDGTTVKASRATKADAWSATPTPANQKLKVDRLDSALTSLTGLRFTDTFEPADANAATARQHLRTFKLTTFDGKTISVALGRKPEEKKLKPPAPAADGKSGPAALGTVADLAKAEAKPQAPAASPDAAPQPLAPEYETIPAGPVFAFITHSDAAAPVNALMQKRAVQIGEYGMTGLPQTPADLFEAAPPPAAPAQPATATPLPAATPAPAAARTPADAPAPAG